MAISALSLPIDIPWKRLCVSDDMIDRQICDRKFPFRWRSSIAVFSYEPPQEDQQYVDSSISYLKVVCTITGFQPDPTEVGLTDRRFDSYWNDPAVIDNYKEMVAKYYGCYGAILEVAIAPPEDAPPEQYPYFVDYEPKKRELYEMVSDTGEMMSRSLEDVNVRKGTTTTDGHEVLDIFGGFSEQGQIAGTGGGLSIQGQWGTRDLSQQEYSNVRTTDSAREQRETYSHTTQLTQMYHQLNSYHLGTNRAVFFVLPRPHIVQSDVTFANGPRILEGIQEFFLVVARPKDTAPPCVEAYLETGHIAAEPVLQYQQSTGTVTLKVTKQLTEDRDCWDCFGDDSYHEYAEGSETYLPPNGWEIDLSRNGGYKIETVSGDNIETYSVTEVAADHLTVFGRVRADFIDHIWPTPNEFKNGTLDVTVTIYIRKKTPDVVGTKQSLWITGRGVCCCNSQLARRAEAYRPSVVYEGPLPERMKSVGPGSQLTARESNEARGLISDALLKSINSPDRYAAGTVSFLDTRFLGNAIAAVVRNPTHVDNVRVRDIVGMPHDIAEKIAKVAPRVSRGRLLQMHAQEVADRFGLSRDEVVKVRRAALGLEGPSPAPQYRWDRPGSAAIDVKVPDVRGLRLDAAREALAGVRLFGHTVEYLDSDRPTDVVLDQDPKPGATLTSRSDVRLSLSTGANVQIPDLVGMSMSEAVCRLRDAGLRAAPEIHYTKATATAGNVVAVRPASRSFVTPYGNVTLDICRHDKTTG